MRKSNLWNLSGSCGGRSAEFQEFLNQQPSEYQRILIAAEKNYVKSTNSEVGRKVATAIDFEQGMRGPIYKVPVSKLLDYV